MALAFNPIIYYIFSCFPLFFNHLLSTSFIARFFNNYFEECAVPLNPKMLLKQLLLCVSLLPQ